MTGWSARRRPTAIRRLDLVPALVDRKPAVDARDERHLEWHKHQPDAGRSGNKLLTMAHANLIWSPVAFVDLGAEYAWGHRVTVANFKGDA